MDSANPFLDNTLRDVDPEPEPSSLPLPLSDAEEVDADELVAIKLESPRCLLEGGWSGGRDNTLGTDVSDESSIRCLRSRRA